MPANVDAIAGRLEQSLGPIRCEARAQTAFADDELLILQVALGLGAFKEDDQ